MTDPFALGRRLGRGAMHEAYRATETASGINTALEVLYPHLALAFAIRERFARGPSS